jgi:enterochelin esterase-like enzyme
VAEALSRVVPDSNRGITYQLAIDTFTQMMFTDLIPMIEQTYRVLPERENRAMAGLSMGGAQTFKTALNNFDKFAYLGGFSGSCAGRDAAFDLKPPAAEHSLTQPHSTEK